MKNGAFGDIQDSDGKTPIFISAEKGNTKILELLCKRYPNAIDIPENKMNNTPAIASVLALKSDSLRVLRHFKADFNK